MKKFLLSVFVLFASCSYAQEIPKSMDQLSEKGDGIVSESDLTAEQKQFFLKNVTTDKNGVHRIKSDARYPQLIRTFKKHPDLQDKIPTEFIKTSEQLFSFGYKFYGVIYEDEFRITLIYTNNEDTDLMLTRWKYRESGATITVAGNMINTSVSGVPAVISLTSPGRGDMMWKCTWWKDGVSYEVYIGDVANSRDTPLLSPEKVINIATTFAK